MSAPVAPGNPRLGPGGWLRWGWRTLTSMRTALWLLALLALAAIPGSLLPQRPTDPAAVLRYTRDHPGLARWLHRVEFFDVFNASWFRAVYLLLMISLVGCLVPRGRMWWRQWRTPAPTPTQAAVEEAVWHQAKQGAQLHQARRWLRRRRYRVRLVQPWPPSSQPGTGEGGLLIADKGRLRELGNLAFHLALLGILVAVALGRHYGYRAEVVVAEGGGFTNSVVQFDSYHPGAGVAPGDLPEFTVSLHQLQVSFLPPSSGQDAGKPEGFAALTTVRDAPGQPQREVRIGPNRPLEVEGTKVYLMGQGYAPRISVRDASGRVVFSGPVILLPREGDRSMTSTGVLKVPDGLADQLGLELTFLPTGLRLPTAQGGQQMVSVFPQASRPVLVITAAWRGDLGLDSGRAQSVYRLDTQAMRPLPGAEGELTPGTTMQLPQGLGSITFDGVSRFAGFTLASDPGRGWALAAALLALLGLVVSLFVYPATVWVWVRPDGSLMVSGQAGRGHEHVHAQTGRLVVWLGESSQIRRSSP